MLDPAFTTALDFFDGGSIYSPDGREHPVTGQTPAYVVPQPPPATNTADPSNVSLASFSWSDILGLAAGKHLLARAVVIVVAILLVAIVAFRLTH